MDDCNSSPVNISEKNSSRLDCLDKSCMSAYIGWQGSKLTECWAASVDTDGLHQLLQVVLFAVGCVVCCRL